MNLPRDQQLYLDHYDLVRLVLQSEVYPNAQALKTVIQVTCLILMMRNQNLPD
jgi:hypothetical protein